MSIAKLWVAYLSGSIGVLSEAIHSLLDLISAGIAFFTVREAGKPADAGHPFGHGKLETLSSLFEALLLVAAALFIVWESVEHFRHPLEVKYPGLAIVIMGVSMILSYWMYKHNGSAAEEVDSSALRINALHFLADVLASAAVLVGLLLITYTQARWIDPLIAMVVAVYIVALSWRQVRGAIGDLTDESLPDIELEQIREILMSYHEMRMHPHDLRTRRAGSARHIDFHLTICGAMTVSQSHAYCDEIEARITEKLPTSSVNIHVEPCECAAGFCQADPKREPHAELSPL